MSSFLVIGIGRFGKAVATELSRMKHDVLAVDEVEDNVAGIIDKVTDVIIGDAKDESVLRSLGVHNFDCAIVAMAGNIEDSILTTMLLKELGAKSIVSKAQNDRHAKILSLVGADRVVQPEHEMGVRVAQSLARQNFIDYLEISPEFGVMEMATPEHWAGKSIVKNNLRRKYGITVIAIRSAGSKKIQFSPSADIVLEKSDKLTVIGSKQELETISQIK